MLSRFKSTVVTSLVTLVLGVAIGFGFFGTTPAVHSQGTTGDPEAQLFRTIYARVNPSVVSINVRIPASAAAPAQGNSFGQPSQTQYAAGSGFVYDTAGHIVTNAHVVDGTDQIEVTFFDGITMHAKLVGIDPDSDLAVIQPQGDVSKYAPVVLANSDQLQVGDRAIAIGNPFENAGTMTQGIVSGLQGQVIGVNEQIASQVRQSSGVSFSIPSNLVKIVADALIKDGQVQHTYLGIGGGSLVLDVNEGLKIDANTRGAFITQVQPGSPAAAAGLKAGTKRITLQGQQTVIGGDIIIAVDKQPVTTFQDLTSYLFTKTTVGQKITLTILRNGQKQDIEITLAARPAAMTSQNG